MQNQSSESDSQEPHFTRHQKRLFSYNQKDECWNNVENFLQSIHN